MIRLLIVFEITYKLFLICRNSFSVASRRAEECLGNQQNDNNYFQTNQARHLQVIRHRHLNVNAQQNRIIFLISRQFAQCTCAHGTKAQQAGQTYVVR